MPVRKAVFFLVLACWTCLQACVLDSMAPHDSAQITSFDLLTGNNPELTEDVTGIITDTTVTLHVPADTDLTSLVPTIQHNGTGVSPAADQPQDFSDPVDYNVIAADGSTHSYRVTVVSAASSRKDIKSFRIDSVPGAIDGTDITLTLPFGTDVGMLRGFVSYSGKSISPESGSIQDFSQPIEYTVTAQDGSSKTFTVTVTIAPSNAKDITGLSVDDGNADINGTQISLTLPHGTDVHELEPVIVYTGASISPEVGSAQDFSEPVTYTVTAADGSTKQYLVSVSLAQSDSKEITKLTLNGRTATIDGDAITLTLPHGTDVTNIAPSIVHNGKNLSPASGVARDFSRPLSYTVTAADGSERVYTVSVSLAPNTAHEITALQIMNMDALISGSTITLSLPFGSDASSLVPTIVHNGESIDPKSGVAQNFTGPVNYIVTAADGSSKQYTVVVTVAKSSAREITQFSVLGVAASMIGETAISVSLPFGSDVTSVVPVIMHNGVSIEPAVNLAQNFHSSVLYTVTASDGETRVYTVTVTVASNSAKDITAFSISDVPGTFSPNSITLTLPFGTDLTMLEPAISITGASVSPSNGQKQDFTNPVTYTVTADDHSTKQYLVAVSAAKADAKEITRFAIGDIAGTITASGISVTLPHSMADVTKLKPSITIAGKSVEPKSGDEKDFTSPVTYTVKADDGSTKPVLVTVTVADAGAKDITGFSILGVPATITSNTITLTLPYGTNPARLTPTFQHIGQSVNVTSGTQRNFTNPQVYTVTANDSTTKDYTVSVNIAAQGAKDILSFDILGITSSFGTNSIMLTVPFGTTVTGLMPQITVSGQSVSPASGQATDFTNAVVYTVKDANNIALTKQYTVTVSVAAM